MHLHPHPSMQWVTGMGLILQKGASQYVAHMIQWHPWHTEQSRTQPQACRAFQGRLKVEPLLELSLKMHLFTLSRIPLLD